MDVADEVSAFAQGCGDVDLFDVHVKQIGQQADVAGREGPQQRDSLLDRVAHVRFVAIQRLVDQRHVVLSGILAEFFEGFAQSRAGRRGVDAVDGVSTLHRADDGRGSERAAEVDDRPNEIAGRPTFRLLVRRQFQSVANPARPGADGGERQMMIDQRLL